MAQAPPQRSWTSGVCLALSAFAPALAAAGKLSLADDGAHDSGVAEALGPVSAHWARLFDALLVAPFELIPLGTRVLRAELAEVALLAVFAGLLFELSVRLLEAVAASARGGAEKTRWAPFIAALATASITLSSTLQGPALAAGSRLGWADLVLFLLLAPRTRWVSVALAALLCLPAADGSSVGSGLPHPVAALSALRADLGPVFLFVALGGFVYAVAVCRRRKDPVPLVVVALAAWLRMALGGVTDPGSAAPALLLGLAAIAIFASVAMLEAVVRVASARIPMASASAAMVVVLEAAFPAIVWDDAATQLDKRPPHALSTWEDAAFSGLASGSRVIVLDQRLGARLGASREARTFPPDLQLLTLYNPSLDVVARSLAADASLVPLFRDFALNGIPEEQTLSALAETAPVVLAAYPPFLDKSLLRHLVPHGLFSVFEPEPRGGADRKHALDASSSLRIRLEDALGKPKEGPLALLTESLLQARYEDAIKMGEKEVAERAMLDVEAFTVRAPGAKAPSVTRTTTMP